MLCETLGFTGSLQAFIQVAEAGLNIILSLKGPDLAYAVSCGPKVHPAQAALAK